MNGARGDRIKIHWTHFFDPRLLPFLKAAMAAKISTSTMTPNRATIRW